MGQNWLRIAEEAEAELARPRQHGTVMAATDEVAARLGTTRQALRNYMSALRFIRAVESENRQAAQALMRLSAAMVAVYARWSRYDRSGALEHALVAGSKLLPASAILAAEAAANQKPGGTAATTLEQAVASAPAGAQYIEAGGAVAWALRRVGLKPAGLSAFTVARTELPLAAAAGVQEILVLEPASSKGRGKGPLLDDRYFRTRHQFDRLEVAGVLDVAETAIKGGYRRIAKPTFVRAVAAACLYPLVLLVLPNREALREFADALPDVPPGRLGVDGEEAPPGVIVPGSGLGGIVMVSADSVIETWEGRLASLSEQAAPGSRSSRKSRA